MKESTILSAVRNALGRTRDCRAFRNSCGAMQDKDGRWVHYGLAPGSGDLIGWRTVTITPSDVGRRMAVFLSVEVKSATGRVAPAQSAWAAAVRAAGGIAGIARSVDEALALVQSPDEQP